MHLAGKPYGLHGLPSRTQCVAKVGTTGSNSYNPVIRILLAPARVGMIRCQWRSGLSQLPPPIIKYHRLHCRSPYVQTKIAHSFEKSLLPI